MNRGHRRLAGFTLVEALVALALFALSSMMGYRGLSALLDGREHLRHEEQHWRALTRCYGLWRSDLDAALDRPARDNFGVAEEGFRADFDAGGTLDAAVSWTRAGAPASGGLAAAPQRIGWRLRGQQIQRLAWLAPDRGPRSEPQVQIILDGVQSMALRYLGPVGASQNWDTRWRMPNHPSLPRAVELTLDLEDGSHLVRTFDLPAAP